jgi:hypothetical protein
VNLEGCLTAKSQSIDWLFLVAGTGLSSISFRKDLRGGLYKENRVFSQLFFYTVILHSNLRLDSVYGIKKPEPNDSGFPCSGDRTILHFISDGPQGMGFTKKSADRCAFFLFTFPSVFESKLSTLLEMQKANHF